MPELAFPPHDSDPRCVHCGLCLDTCPTYRLTGVEAESPRGRLYLMNAVTEGSIEFNREVVDHLDSCLGCLACESACPSGIRYGQHIEDFRPRIANSPRTILRRARGFMARAGSKTTLLRVARAVATVLDNAHLEALRRRVPGLGLIPRSPQNTFKSRVPPPSKPRLRVALLIGCITDEVRPSITNATINVLHRNGVEVVPLPRETCCGALHLHSGNSAAATLAAAGLCRQIDPSSVDYIVTTAAGCGAMVRKYGDFTKSRERDFAIAAWVAENTRDVCELLVEIGVQAPGRGVTEQRAVAYHDACHLLHGCGVAQAPRELLTTAGAQWFDLGENAICCGSAGVYTLLHPRESLQLARRKVDLLIAAGASDLAIGNIGCLMQLEFALARAGRRDVNVWHPVELLEAAYQAEVGESG